MRAGELFEQKVRAIARSLWSAEPGEGSPELIDGKERDIIIRNEDVTYYIECTMLPSKDKAVKDCQKLSNYRETELRKGRVVSCWFITEKEPTADQHSVAKSKRVRCMSLSQLRTKLINAEDYINCRNNYPFGSARDPDKDDSDRLSGITYQPVKLHISEVAASIASKEHSATIEDIGQLLTRNTQVALLGDFGMGKSIAIYNIFKFLAKKCRKDALSPVPVVLNLRDHWGQENPSEALMRHARNIGFRRPEQLVRAFNAGQLSIILDGFDEIVRQSWSNKDKESAKSRRKSAVRLVKMFSERSRGNFGLLAAGREHFFDTHNDRQEMVDALGLSDKAIAVSLREFSEAELESFLKARHIDEAVPAWIPRRPLLLAKLTSKDLQEIIIKTADREPADAWDELINAVCERESKIHEDLDAQSIRRVIENLATEVRLTPSGLGPITETMLVKAFREETEANPDHAVLPLLGRLPGLSARDAQVGTRMFIDDQMVDVLRAKYVKDFVNGFLRLSDKTSGSNRIIDWQIGLGDVGIQFVANQTSKMHTPNGAQAVLLNQIKKISNNSDFGTLCADCVNAALRIAIDEEKEIDYQGAVVSQGSFSTLDLSNEISIKNLTIKDSIINRLHIGGVNTQVTFKNCLVNQLDGISHQKSLPEWLDITVEKFGAPETNASILADKNIDIQIKILTIALRKLYLQRGSGRKESAFYRGGIPPNSQKLVQSVLAELRRADLARSIVAKNETIWVPVMSQSVRAQSIIHAPTLSDDEVVHRVRRLSR